VWALLYSLVMRSSDGWCENGNEHSGCIKSLRLRDQLSEHQLLKNKFCCLLYRSFVNYWPIKFSSGKAGASRLHSETGIGLVDETKALWS
jgi:hypothetical protein